MEKCSFFVSIFILCLGSIQLQENWMTFKNQKQSVGCNSIENFKVATIMECAILSAQRSDVNLADFNVLLSTCELKFCNKIYEVTFTEGDNSAVIRKGCK